MNFQQCVYCTAIIGNRIIKTERRFWFYIIKNIQLTKNKKFA